ncbi:MAG: MBOAT family protein [Oscillospiraceae bacterium]|nr:MBOAT family protein [Oscillospiraceae bacterium]
MVFSSAIFLFIFLPAVFVLYRFVPSLRWKNALLAAASLVFYAFGQLWYVPLFLASVLINYGAGLLLGRMTRGRRAVITACVALNLLILGVFKYADFAVANVNALFGAAIRQPGIELPIGISFFTFQGLSYSIDVYRDKNSGTKDFLKLLLFISFFPQLIAGPIVKYHDIAEQIDDRNCTGEETAAGIRRFIVGLSKKVLIANAVGLTADRVFNEFLPASGLGLDWRLAWLGAVCYTLQIYFDFSGYSDMAIGLARMFGFRIRENFNLPYAALSIRDFWRRWHISLSSWFKEYLYIPLGGNRKGRGRAALNRLIVFFCTGIWHGANWTFVFWGLGHGVLSSLEGVGAIPADKLKNSLLGRFFCRLYTLLAVTLLFVVFRADDLASAFTMIGAMFRFQTAPFASFELRRMLSAASVFVLILAILLSGRLTEKLRERFSASERLRGPAALALRSALCLGLYLLSILSLSRGGFNPFIYFQF